MLISAREAATLLAIEAGLSREPARKLLASGLAGEAQRTAGALLYDSDLVRALTRRRQVAPYEIPATCRAGLFVARLNPAAHLKSTAPQSGWHVSPWVRVRIRSRIQTTGSFPFLATVAGYVTEGADIVGFDFQGGQASDEAGEQRTTFVTTAPGPWFDAFRGQRFDTGPGGPWLIWPQPSSRPRSIA